MSSTELKAESARLNKIIYENEIKKLNLFLNFPSLTVNHLLNVLKTSDPHGNTTIHIAAILGNYECIQLILGKVINSVEEPIASKSEIRISKATEEHLKTKTASSPQSPESSESSSENTNSFLSPEATTYIFYLREIYSLCFIKRNRNQWTAFDEAVARGDRTTIAFFLKLINIYQVIISIQHSKSMKKATKEKLLQHDFKIKIKFDLNSWIPLLSRFLPQDDITVFHQKNNFRMDFHIVPGGGDTGALLWARGNYSIILNSSEKTAIFLNHDKKEGQWIITADAGRRGNEKGPKINSADLSLKEIISAKTAINNWICSTDENATVPLTLVNLLHIENDEIAKQVNLVMSKPVQRPGLSTHNTSFAASSKNFFGFGTGKSSTFGEFKANNFQVQGLEMVVRSRNEHLSSEDKDRHEKMKSINNSFKNGGKDGLENAKKKGQKGQQSQSDEQPSIEAPGADLFSSPERQIAQIENDAALAKELELSEEHFKAQIDDMEELLNQCSEKYKPTIKPEPYYAKPSFEQYMSLPHPIKQQLGNGRKINSKVKRYPVKGKISLCEDFPIQKSSFLNIIAAAAPKFRHFERLKEFMEMRMPEGFPVHLDCPIIATVSAQLTVLDLKIFKGERSSLGGHVVTPTSEDNSVKASLFKVPKNYIIKKESSV